jgi:cell wall-associated NlpC family hydrolase
MHKRAYRAIGRVLAFVLVAALVSGATLTASSPSIAAPSRAQLDAAQERLRELERDFELTVERFNLVRDELEEIQAEIAVEETTVGRIEERMSVNERAAASVAEELYKGGSTETLQVVLAADSLAQMETGLEYLRSSEDAQARVFERLALDRQALNEHITRMERQQARALEAKRDLAELRTEIEAKLAGQRSEIEQLTTLIERAERRRELREERAAQAAAEAAAESTAAPVASAPAPEAPAPQAPAPPPSGSRAGVAVQTALAQVGKPYSWGAAGPSAFDCSGLTMFSWAQAGVGLPHNSGAQYAATARVSQGDWQPGDLLFYGSPIHHVAMYIGGGRVVEAPYTGTTVRVASALRSDYVGAGRPGV